MLQRPIKTYKFLFFDLDRTLWDYRSNSEQTIRDLLNRYSPELNSRFEEFLNVFYETNELLWIEYRDGRLDKNVLSIQRFLDSFKRFGVDATSFAKQLSIDYINESPNKTKLFPHTFETLEYLRSKSYRLFLITNGFIEVQRVKIRDSKIEHFFEKMFASEDIGYQKPNAKIFEYALNNVNAPKSESIMIGDDLESDISGAQQFGMDTVYFNPEKLKHVSKPTFEINGLNELKDIFR